MTAGSRHDKLLRLRELVELLEATQGEKQQKSWIRYNSGSGTALCSGVITPHKESRYIRVAEKHT